jgi:hypothetical protein
MTLHFSSGCIYGFDMIHIINSDYFHKSINQLTFVMETCCIFFEVRTECLQQNLHYLDYLRLHCLIITLLTSKGTENCGRGVNAPASYLGEPGFKPRPGDRLC